jgi:hypothetical protein
MVGALLASIPPHESDSIMGGNQRSVTVCGSGQKRDAESRGTAGDDLVDRDDRSPPHPTANGNKLLAEMNGGGVRIEGIA